VAFRSWLSRSLKIKSCLMAKAVDEERIMKKLVLVSLFVLAGFGLVFGANIGTLGVSGTISPTLAVVVTAGGGATTLDLATTTTGTTVGTAKFTTNNKTWKIALHSTNGSKLKASGVTDEVAYTFSLGTLLVGATLPSALPGTPQVNMTAKTAAAGDDYDMIIIYTGVANLTAATYSDTITVTVSAP